MKFRHVIRAINVVSDDIKRNGSNDKIDAFLSKLPTMDEINIERALRVRESGVSHLFSLAAKGEFEQIAELLGLEEPPRSYAEALKIISKKKKLSEIYRI